MVLYGYTDNDYNCRNDLDTVLNFGNAVVFFQDIVATYGLISVKGLNVEKISLNDGVLPLVTAVRIHNS
jgi:hypothetical protein